MIVSVYSVILEPLVGNWQIPRLVWVKVNLTAPFGLADFRDISFGTRLCPVSALDMQNVIALHVEKIKASRYSKRNTVISVPPWLVIHGKHCQRDLFLSTRYHCIPFVFMHNVRPVASE